MGKQAYYIKVNCLLVVLITVMIVVMFMMLMTCGLYMAVGYKVVPCQQNVGNSK
ncbi:hypothetical protein DYBT9623_05201 [Dyadobacter sp. CECT 9623]|uniref:Uncharacterized protein n=1 Tax=Dyadobacter linearis TaxID=2823330 RepID=A0ABM8UXX5_9BACT|nr:hypothetical protein DYBT9623_05201 [Dyadobacter sp. CECT 9623]